MLYVDPDLNSDPHLFLWSGSLNVFRYQRYQYHTTKFVQPKIVKVLKFKWKLSTEPMLHGTWLTYTWSEIKQFKLVKYLVGTFFNQTKKFPDPRQNKNGSGSAHKIPRIRRYRYLPTFRVRQCRRWRLWTWVWWSGAGGWETPRAARWRSNPCISPPWSPPERKKTGESSNFALRYNWTIVTSLVDPEWLFPNRDPTSANLRSLL